MEQFFYHTNQYYTRSSQLQQFISTRAIWEYVPYIDIATNFEPLEYYDDFLLDLNQAFPGTLTLYKVPAKSMYRWHRDERFKWAFNMVLDSYYSHSIFQTEYVEEGSITRIVELEYKPLEWAIFNPTEPHCVMNLGTQDRILATYRHYKRDFETAPDYFSVVEWYKNYSK